MNRLQLRKAIRSPEDETTFKRWRRGVLIAYGIAVAILVAAWSAGQFVHNAYTNAAAVVDSPSPTAPGDRR